MRFVEIQGTEREEERDNSATEAGLYFLGSLQGWRIIYHYKTIKVKYTHIHFKHNSIYQQLQG